MATGTKPVKLKAKTIAAIEKMGQFKESYDSVIWRIIQENERNRKASK